MLGLAMFGGKQKQSENEKRAAVHPALFKACEKNLRAEIFVAGRAESFVTTFVGIDLSSGEFHTDILLPRHGERLLTISGEPALFSLHLNGVNHRFTAEYSGNGAWDGFSSLRFLLPQNVESFQRRGFFRVSPLMSRPVAIKAILGDINMEAEASDISLGGARFIARYALENGSVIGVKISLPSGEMVEARFTVIECREKTAPRRGAAKGKIYELRGEFQNLKQEAAAAINRYILRRERETLRIYN